MKRPLTVSIPHHFHHGPLLIESFHHRHVNIPHCMVTNIGKVFIDNIYRYHCYQSCDDLFFTCIVCVTTR